MPAPDPTPYRVTQFALPDSTRPPRNIGVSDLESLVTHHPFANRRGHLVDGVPKGVEREDKRSYAVVGGELQEVQASRTDRQYRSLAPDQVLLVKDFILDDPTAADSRRVDVPAPIAGVIGRVDARNGVVDICEIAGGPLIARIRHLGPIAVAVGEDVAYGQSLGTQNNIGLPRQAGKHVHVEMDTRHYQQFDHYIRDLVDGRLPVQAVHRKDVEPRPLRHDGVQRVGESGERVAVVQRALVAGGHRAIGDAPIVVDGTYRLSMQGAVLAFQHDHGLAETGDVDAPTWRVALDLTFGKPALPPAVMDTAPCSELPRGQLRQLEQIRGHLEDHAATQGGAFDTRDDRMALSLAALAAGRRFASADHVLLVQPAAGAPAGGRAFVVQGRLDDPAHLRVSMSVAEALATPPADSLRQLHALALPAPDAIGMSIEHRGVEPHRTHGA